MSSDTGRMIAAGGCGVVDTATSVSAAPQSQPPASTTRPAAVRQRSQSGARPSARKGSAGMTCRGPNAHPPSQ